MNHDTLTQVAVIAQYHDDSAVWTKDSFRFKHQDTIGRGALQQLRHYGIIEKDDTWSTPTWEWTQSGSRAIEMCDTAPLTEASDDQLTALMEHAERLLQLPVDDDFVVSEFNEDTNLLRGQSLQTLSQNDLLVKVGERDETVVWELSPLMKRTVVSLEAQEMKLGNSNNSPILAD